MQTTYREIFTEISRQISNRKKIIIQRALLITWPLILCVITMFVYNQITGVGIDILISSSVSNMIITGMIFFLILIYTIIMSSILRIEKMIWVDSFFDKKNLTTKGSFTVSRKLFWPFLKLGVVIFFRYYFWVWLSIPAIIIISAFIISPLGLSENGKLLIFMITYITMIIGVFSLLYFLRIKLRYIRFIFLDSYKGTSMNISNVITTNKQLNQIFKSESFKKALFSQLGVDSAQAITNMVTNSLSSLLSSGGSMLGGFGGESVKAVAGVANMYAKEYARQIADLSRVVSMYVLYREALKQLTGNEQIDNEYIYNLK
jgi:hypothetical protein